jgi:uncharacterized membrane protein YkvI
MAFLFKQLEFRFVIVLIITMLWTFFGFGPLVNAANTFKNIVAFIPYLGISVLYFYWIYVPSSNEDNNQP